MKSIKKIIWILSLQHMVLVRNSKKCTIFAIKQAIYDTYVHSDFNSFVESGRQFPVSVMRACSDLDRKFVLQPN